MEDAACYFDAMCEGLADMELRGTLPPGEEGRVWRDALSALVGGLAIPTRPERLRSDTKGATDLHPPVPKVAWRPSCDTQL